MIVAIAMTDARTRKTVSSANVHRKRVFLVFSAL